MYWQSKQCLSGQLLNILDDTLEYVNDNTQGQNIDLIRSSSILVVKSGNPRFAT